MGDGSFEALLELAHALLGRPYVWGASGPNSFDCSGLVYFLLNHSRAANVGRTTAQGYFNMSSLVSPNEARPGDLIFFQGTFSSPRFITHVSIYLGNGYKVHTGSNPNGVEIVRLNTPFWQQHFHAFGRVS
jgi:cell wall-associated NlpC family hydrolase